MKTAQLLKDYGETLISGVLSMLLMTALLALLIITGHLFAANADERIAAAARESFEFQAALKGDDIQIASQDGAVTLTGTVAEERHLFLAVNTVAELPGVRRVENRLAVKPAQPGHETTDPGYPSSEIFNMNE